MKGYYGSKSLVQRSVIDEVDLALLPLYVLQCTHTLENFHIISFFLCTLHKVSIKVTEMDTNRGKKSKAAKIVATAMCVNPILEFQIHQICHFISGSHCLEAYHRQNIHMCKESPIKQRAHLGLGTWQEPSF